MINAKPVTVIISVQLEPGFRESWLELWSNLQTLALDAPSCRQFRLFADRHDAAQYVVLTEWDGAPDFNAFARKAGLVWLDDGLHGTCRRTRYTILEAITGEREEAVHMQRAETVLVLQ